LLELQFLRDNHREYLWAYRLDFDASGIETDLSALRFPHMMAPGEDLIGIIREAGAKGWFAALPCAACSGRGWL
ncbi:MAG: hypothetical protein R6X13_08485, partial [bacterium]